MKYKTVKIILLVSNVLCENTYPEGDINPTTATTISNEVKDSENDDCQLVCKIEECSQQKTGKTAVEDLRNAGKQETIDHKSDLENQAHDIPAAPISPNSSFSANGTSGGDEGKKSYDAAFEENDATMQDSSSKGPSSDEQGKEIQKEDGNSSGNNILGRKQLSKIYSEQSSKKPYDGIEADKEEMIKLTPGGVNQTHDITAAAISQNSSFSVNGTPGGDERKKNYDADSEDGKQETIDHQSSIENQKHDIPAAPISPNSSFSANCTSDVEERKKNDDADTEAGEQETYDLQPGVVNQKHDITAAQISKNSSFSENGTVCVDERKESNAADTEDLARKQETIDNQSCLENQKNDITAAPKSPNSSFLTNGSLGVEERKKSNDTEDKAGKQEQTDVNQTHDIQAAQISPNASRSANGTASVKERKKSYDADTEDLAGKQKRIDHLCGLENQAHDISPNSSFPANGTSFVEEIKKSNGADFDDLAGEQQTNDLQPGVENQTHVTQAAQISTNSSLSANGEEDRKKSNGADTEAGKQEQSDVENQTPDIPAAAAISPNSSLSANDTLEAVERNKSYDADTEAGKQVTIDHQGDLENQTHDLPAAPISPNLSFSANGTSGGEERKKSNDADIEDDEEEINLQNGEVNQKHDIPAAPKTPNSSFSANDSLSEEEIAKSNDTEVLVGKQETTVHQSGAISPSSSFSASGDERQKIYCAEPEVRKSDACKVSETPPRKGPKVEMENPNHMCHDAGEHISTRPSPITHESVNEDEASQYNVEMRPENGKTFQCESDQDTKTVNDAHTSKESSKENRCINNGERGKVQQESKALGKSSPSVLDQSQMKPSEKAFSPDVDLLTVANRFKKRTVDSRSPVAEADDDDSNLSLISSGLKKIKDQKLRNSVLQDCLKLIQEAQKQDE